MNSVTLVHMADGVAEQVAERAFARGLHAVEEQGYAGPRLIITNPDRLFTHLSLPVGTRFYYDIPHGSRTAGLPQKGELTVLSWKPKLEVSTRRL